MAIYTQRKFKHSDWIDNYDRVKAGGPDGFNDHFHAIEVDLDSIADSFASLGATVAAPVTIGLPPILYQFQNQLTWSAIRFGYPAGVNPMGDGTFATMTASAGVTEAWGAVPLSLPNGVKMTNLAVLGSSPSGTMKTELYEEQHSNGATNSLATVPGFTPFPLVAKPVFAGAVNLYYLVAYIQNVTVGDTPLLRGFSITYEPA